MSRARTEGGEDRELTGQHQRMARALVVAMHGAVRAIRLYPVENVAVQRALQDLSNCVAQIQGEGSDCEVRHVGDYLFINETRLRLTLDNYAAVTALLALFRDAGVGGIVVRHRPEPRAWIVLLAFLQAPPAELDPEARYERLVQRLEQAGIPNFEVTPPSDETLAGDDLEPGQRERSRQTYARSMDVTREAMSATRLGRSPSLKRVKRAVHGVVDAVLNDSISMIGLTMLREFDEPTFVHSVNVCIMSIALGRRLGLNKTQLLDLGLAALMHDMGKSKLAPELMNKGEPLTAEERVLLRDHTWEGALALLELPAGSGRPWRAVTVAYEHHMRMDLRGFPAPGRTVRQGFFSKLIAVVDVFDNATTGQVPLGDAVSPAEILERMRDDASLGLDPVIVKAFINLTGIYPVGTLVVLDTMELAVVHGASATPTALSRPMVRVLTDRYGNRLTEPVLRDLTATDADGQFLSTIIRTDDPERHGMTIADFFA